MTSSSSGGTYPDSSVTALAGEAVQDGFRDHCRVSRRERARPPLPSHKAQLREEKRSGCADLILCRGPARATYRPRFPSMVPGLVRCASRVFVLSARGSPASRCPPQGGVALARPKSENLGVAAPGYEDVCGFDVADGPRRPRGLASRAWATSSMAMGRRSFCFEWFAQRCGGAR